MRHSRLNLLRLKRGPICSPPPSFNRLPCISVPPVSPYVLFLSFVKPLHVPGHVHSFTMQFPLDLWPKRDFAHQAIARWLNRSKQCEELGLKCAKEGASLLPLSRRQKAEEIRKKLKILSRLPSSGSLPPTAPPWLERHSTCKLNKVHGHRCQRSRLGHPSPTQSSSRLNKPHPSPHPTSLFANHGGRSNRRPSKTSSNRDRTFRT